MPSQMISQQEAMHRKRNDTPLNDLPPQHNFNAHLSVSDNSSSPINDPHLADSSYSNNSSTNPDQGSSSGKAPNSVGSSCSHPPIQKPASSASVTSTSTLRCSPALPFSSSCTPSPPGTPPIPKAITDRLLDHERRITTLETQIEHDNLVIQSLHSAKSDVQFQIQDLDNKNTALLKWMDTVERLLAKQSKQMDSLSSLPHAKPVPDSDEEDVKKPCDNAFNITVPKAFLMAMRLPKTTKLKDAVHYEPAKKHGGYVCTETNSQLLRPDWKTSYMEAQYGTIK
ncbi:hypothetical protein K438DRAFT_2047661 [Mycena galopus ATCC 62051]|nr:hypothetical protein K438DRAFT_2047661 [Mycena galopus ATCC 62051]